MFITCHLDLVERSLDVARNDSVNARNDTTVGMTMVVEGINISQLFRVIATGFLAATVLDEASVDEGGDVAFDALGGDAGGFRYLRDGVAGVGDEAGEDDALGGVDAGNGADDAVFETDGEVAGVVVEELGVGGFFFVRTRIVRMGRIFRCCVAPTWLSGRTGL